MGHAPVDARDLSSFEVTVKRVVASIPRGTVLAYGEVALLAGKPGGARAVVRALHRLSGIPWWRVVRADRTLAPEIAPEQGQKLRAEGVEIKGRRIVATSPRPGSAPASAASTSANAKSSSGGPRASPSRGRSTRKDQARARKPEATRARP